MTPEYPQIPYHSTLIYNPGLSYSGGLDRAGNFSGWNHPDDLYRHTRYDSPNFSCANNNVSNGYYQGSISEASDEYALSPDTTRQHIALSPARFLSPAATEGQYSQHTWSAESSFIPNSSSPHGDVHTSSIALKELEFRGISDFQIENQDYDASKESMHLPMNVPEELELSESTATLTASSRANTNLSSNYDSSSSISSPAQESDSDSDFNPKRNGLRHHTATRNPRLRLPRQSITSYPTLDTKNRVNKPTHSRSLSNKDKSKPRPIPPMSSQSSVEANSKLPKSFPCTFHHFGCPATFANKNEWKRHVSSQHLQLGFYRCDLGNCNPDNQLSAALYEGATQASRSRGHTKRRSASATTNPFNEEHEKAIFYNDFNRKDLFTQHCRRMHGPGRHLEDETTETNQKINTRLRALGRKMGSGKPINTKDDEAAFEGELEQIRLRCWKLRRRAPERTSCGFCGRLFEASAHSDKGNEDDGHAEEKAWEERMEHLGRHYERDGCSPSMENTDPDLLEWGMNEGILEPRSDVGPWLVGYEVPRNEEAEEEQRREGLRRRGPKRKASLRTDTHIKLESSNGGEVSDMDAMAEDD